MDKLPARLIRKKKSSIKNERGGITKYPTDIKKVRRGYNGKLIPIYSTTQINWANTLEDKTNKAYLKKTENLPTSIKEIKFIV